MITTQTLCIFFSNELAYSAKRHYVRMREKNFLKGVCGFPHSQTGYFLSEKKILFEIFSDDYRDTIMS